MEINDLNEKKIGVSEYAPKKKVDLTELEKAMAEPAKYPPHVYQYNANNEAITAIKDNIKKLTHRQMRQMCEDIFTAMDKIESKKGIDGIGKVDLPDVLDRFAHGD